MRIRYSDSKFAHIEQDNVKHFDTSQCAIRKNTSLAPINKQASLMLSKDRENWKDPNFVEAMGILDVLSGQGLITRGGGVVEAANQIAALLKKRETAVVESTLSPELMEIEKQKIALSQQKLHARREETKLKKIFSEEKRRVRQFELDRSKSIDALFKKTAKRLLTHDEYIIIALEAEAQHEAEQQVNQSL